MLAAAGLDPRKPTPGGAWEVFKRFAARPVDCASDGLLFECGVYEFTGKAMFHFAFVRQFTIDKDGNYDHMQQLHIEFLFTPTLYVRDLRFEKWSSDLHTMEEFFRFIEARPEFRTVIDAGVTAADVQVYQERI